MAATTEPVTEPTPSAPAAPSAATSAPVDVQAQINAALAAQQADFARQLKETTGHADLKALAEANLKAQGKLQELADAKSLEAQSYKAKFESSQISSALLAAATEAIDPTIVTALLGSRCVCDDKGVVTLDGKPVADAVNSLLLDKPFLARAQGSSGSGAPRLTSAPVKNPWMKGQVNLTEQIRLDKENPSLAAQLKAAAGR